MVTGGALIDFEVMTPMPSFDHNFRRNDPKMWFSGLFLMKNVHLLMVVSVKISKKANLCSKNGCFLIHQKKSY